MSGKEHGTFVEEDIDAWWLKQTQSVFPPHPRSLMPSDPIEVFRHPCYSYNVYHVKNGQKFNPSFQSAAGSSPGYAVIDVLEGIFSVGFRLKNAFYKWERFWTVPIQRFIELIMISHLGEKVIFLAFCNPRADITEYFSFRFLFYRAECAFMQKLYMILNEVQPMHQIKEEQPNLLQAICDQLEFEKPQKALRPASPPEVKVSDDVALEVFPTPGSSTDEARV